MKGRRRSDTLSTDVGLRLTVAFSYSATTDATLDRGGIDSVCVLEQVFCSDLIDRRRRPYQQATSTAEPALAGQASNPMTHDCAKEFPVASRSLLMRSSGMPISFALLA